MVAVLMSISLVGRHRDHGVCLTENDRLNAGSHQLEGLTKLRPYCRKETPAELSADGAAPPGGCVDNSRFGTHAAAAQV